MKHFSRKDITRLLRKDDKTIKKLYNIFYFRIKTFVSSKISDKDDIEHVIEKIFLKAINSCYLYDYKLGNFESFLLIISRTVLIDFIRVKKNSVVVELCDIEEFNHIPDPNKIRFSNVFNDLKNVLTKEEFTVVVLRDIFKVKFSVISKRMKCSKYLLTNIYNEGKRKSKEYFEKIYKSD